MQIDQRGLRYPSILSTATYAPENKVSTEELLSVLKKKMSPELYETMKRLQIESRYSSIKDYPHYINGESPRQPISSAVNLAIGAIRNLEKEGQSLDDLGLLIFGTNTSNRHFPCFAYEVISEMGTSLPHFTNILNMSNQGCSVLIKMVEMASYYLMANPSKKVLVVTSEAHSSYAPAVNDYCYGFQEIIQHSPVVIEREIKNSQRLLGVFLFGDGAFASVLGYDDEKPQLGPFSHCTNQSPGDQDVLSMDDELVLSPGHLYFPYYHMSKEVPAKGVSYTQKTVSDLLSTTHEERKASEFDFYFIHTGSQKILDKICQFLEISPDSERVRSSYKILHEYGNLSASSIGFIMHDHFGQTAKAKGTGLIVSFGAGFSASAGIVRLD